MTGLKVISLWIVTIAVIAIVVALAVMFSDQIIDLLLIGIIGLVTSAFMVFAASNAYVKWESGRHRGKNKRRDERQIEPSIGHTYPLGSSMALDPELRKKK